MSYDKRMLHKLSNWKDIQGALTRLSISVEEDTSRMLIRAYDVDSDGQMHYLLFIKDMVSEDKHFLAGPRPVSGAPPSAGPGTYDIALSMLICRYRDCYISISYLSYLSHCWVVHWKSLIFLSSSITSYSSTSIAYSHNTNMHPSTSLSIYQAL